MYNILLIFHIFIALSIIGLVLLQHGKGADAGATFGSGASNTVFGSQGSSSFLVRLTAILALCFATTSISLGILNTRSKEPSLLERLERQGQQEQQEQQQPKVNDIVPD